jgi:hypothetical protein
MITIITTAAAIVTIIIGKGSSVATVTRLSAEQPKNRGSILDRERFFSFVQILHIGLGAHPTSFSTSTRGLFS